MGRPGLAVIKGTEFEFSQLGFKIQSTNDWLHGKDQFLNLSFLPHINVYLNRLQRKSNEVMVIKYET